MFEFVWLEDADRNYIELETAAKKSLDNRKKNKKAKASPVEGLLKQVDKAAGTPAKQSPPSWS